MRPFILITNDDGIHAPGIKHLWQAVHEFADIAIVAPQSEKSGSGLGITWTKPLHVHPIPWELNTPAWTVNGTPADCVKMALAVVLDKPPTMIISGINRGSNAGRTVLYSGTVGGVIEGALRGIPGIAFSFSDFDPPPLSATKDYIFPLIKHFINAPLPSGTLLNVNFPFNCKEGVKGFKMARQGKSYWKESPDKRIHPEGAPYYWLGGQWGSVEEDPSSDVSYLEQGYITATPIHVGEMTCGPTLEKYKDFSEKDFIFLDDKQLPTELSR
ncbi:MAG: 5'/3'-nucleotidase SurE [Chlamydiae bacterium CG10_big_fil_rev_8_21_14_0_10_42_34]|nr:MAG: 5'/3'-nucleotidase SurE [Chlamydiae bacterium CG10_big_fil_rev_8_21_14_0_10_42_34]